MAPKPIAPKKAASSGVSAFPVAARQAPIVVRVMNPIKQRSVALCGRDFIYTLQNIFETRNPAADVQSTPALTGTASTTVSPPLLAASKVEVSRIRTLETSSLVSVSDEDINRLGRLIAVAAGRDHLLFATADGLFGCGSNEHGQLGDSYTSTGRVLRLSLPRMYSRTAEAESTRIAPPPKVISVAAGSHHSVVLVLRTREDAFFDAPESLSRFVPFSEILTAGCTFTGALGHISSVSADALFAGPALDSGPASATWAPVGSLGDECVTAVFAGNDLTFARGRSGLFMWGTMPRRFRVLVPCLILPSGEGVVSHVAVAEDSICVALQDGSLRSWRPSMRLGDIVDPAVLQVTWQNPLQLPHKDLRGAAPRGTPVVNLSAGRSHFAALFLDGQLLAWGDNGFGQCSSSTIDAASAPHYAELLPALDEKASRAPHTQPPPLASTPKPSSKLSVASARGGSMRKVSRTASFSSAVGDHTTERSDTSHNSPTAGVSRPPSAAAKHVLGPQGGTEPKFAAFLLGTDEQKFAINVTCTSFATVVLASDGSLSHVGRLFSVS